MKTIKFKKTHLEACSPKQIKIGDAGFDLTTVNIKHTDNYIEYDTGISVEIPENHVGLIFPRSSVTNKDLVLGNSVGVIDSNYRGNVKVRFKIINHHTQNQESFYKIGDRVCQLIVLKIPSFMFQEVNELSETERNQNGFGSSGN